VLLVEDHPVVRHGLAMLIDHEPDLAICGEAVSIAEAMRCVQQNRPDIVIVDIALPDGSGLDLIKQLHIAEPGLAMLAMSMHDEAAWAERAVRAGARGYIMKKEAMDRVMVALRRVLAGEMYVSDRMASKMLLKLMHPAGASETSPMDALSDREFEIFNLIARGIGPTEIAQKLKLSVKTIQAHRENIKEKLHLDNAVDLTRFAFRWAMQNG
jgi:DNA-binding NarL/FixJ family response regulator